MKLPFSTDFFDSLAYQTMRSQRLGMPHITRALAFQGIDAMSFVVDHKDRLTREAFLAWTEKYMSFPEPTQVLADELFKSRQKHLPPLKKRVALRGSGRMIEFLDEIDTAEISLSDTNPQRIRMRTDFFADTFLMGMTTFMHELKGNPELAQHVSRRLERLPFSWRAAMSVMADEMRLRELPAQ